MFNVTKINWGAISENPMVWFILSLGAIALGIWRFDSVDTDGKFGASLGTLFVSLGTAGIMRVRTPRTPSPLRDSSTND